MESSVLTKKNATVSMETANAATLKYFNGDDLATRVWVNKYALKDSDGNLYEATPDDMHWRIANEIAKVEAKYKNPLSAQEVFDLIKDFKYIIPQGSPMTGIGNNFQIASLSNCFVIGNGTDSDSYGSIMKVDEEQVQLMKRRGGVGHDLSHIRPKGSAVKNSALTSTGLVPFMERYSNSTREVAQDGRRGALMLSVSINHPDAEDFINAKLEQGKITGANISVRIDDEFMNAVKNNTEYTQKYPIHSETPKFSKTVEAKNIWNKIV
ncbi:MAG: ribonucleoside-diphosphate reductase, adenosylcobalamin-dependent, partial [Chryseobacterium sp.]|nr:ribonucleoside-diphosphate reductase, adenosylcobalamin-dependent [Chryseobacterium sp.]